MPKFESPLGSKNFNNPNRDIVVPDESGYQMPPSPLRSNRPMQEEQQMPMFDENSMREFQAQVNPTQYQHMHSQNPHMPREMTQMEQEILAAKKAKREGKERLSEGARRRIEMLIGMSRLNKDVDIVGQTWKLQSLTSQELRDAVVASAEFDGTVQFIFEHRKQLLARSITIVAGVEINQFLNSYHLEDKLEFIEHLDHALLLRLFTEYNILANEAQDKYNPKTEVAIKEVMDDVKK